MDLPPKIQELKKRIHRTKRDLFRVASGSMEPVIMKGEMIEVVPVTLEELGTFDIVLFWGGEVLVCHYLWHINRIPDSYGSKVITTRALKGGEDLPTPWASVLGRIVSHKIPTWRKIRLLLPF